MTTLPPDPPEIDPLVTAASAALDGTATPEDRALLAAEPERAREVGRSLRDVARTVGRPVDALPADAADAAIAAALQAFDEGGADAVVVPLARRSPARWLAPLAAVAAALLLVVGIAGAMRSRDADDTTTAAVKSEAAGVSTVPAAADAAQAAVGAPAERSDLQAGSGSGGVAADGASPAGAASSTSYSTAVLDGGDVGAITDPSALAERIVDAINGATDDPSTVKASSPSGEVAACVSKAEGAAPVPIVNLRWRATGTYEGAKVAALAYEKKDGSGLLLLVFATRDCALLTSEDF
jgi:hypothetical protein